MRSRLSRRKLASFAVLCLALAAGALLVWGERSLRPAPHEGDAARRPAAAAADRSYANWPVILDEPRPVRPAARGQVRAESEAGETATGLQELPSLAAGPAEAAGQGPGLAAPTPAGLGSSTSATERERLMDDRNATERSTPRGPIRARGGIRIVIPEDDQCVPRPPRPQF